MKARDAAASPPPRARRSGDDARNAILDATEQRLVASGPSGIRLQDVAADVGVGHTTILHHFGSRERLVDAVVQRRIDHMNADVLGVAASGKLDHDVVAPLLARLFEVFADGGHARVVAFLALAGAANPSLEGVAPLVRAVQALRLANTAPGAKRPQVADSEFLVMLTTFAFFGEAIAGPMFRGEPPDAPDPAARARFLERLTRHVEAMLAAGGELAPAAAVKARRTPRRATKRASE